MLADFATRLAFGLAISLLLISWRAVPLGFFRTQSLVILGLLVLAGLDQARAGGPAWLLWALIAGAVMAYTSAVSWGLGLPRLGGAVSVLAALVTAGWLVTASQSASAELWALNASSRLSSGFLLGSTLTAMLLGHHYLTAPAMSIEPLKRLIGLMAWALVMRCVLAVLGTWASQQGTLGLGPSTQDTQTGMFLAARWGMGFVGTAIATFMTWRTARIPVDPVGDRNPLYRHDLRSLRRAHGNDPLASSGDHVLNGKPRQWEPARATRLASEGSGENPTVAPASEPRWRFATLAAKHCASERESLLSARNGQIWQQC